MPVCLSRLSECRLQSLAVCLQYIRRQNGKIASTAYHHSQRRRRLRSSELATVVVAFRMGKISSHRSKQSGVRFALFFSFSVLFYYTDCRFLSESVHIIVSQSTVFSESRTHGPRPNESSGGWWLELRSIVVRFMCLLILSLATASKSDYTR